MRTQAANNLQKQAIAIKIVPEQGRVVKLTTMVKNDYFTDGNDFSHARLNAY